MAYTGPRGSGQVLLTDYLTRNKEAGQRMGNALASATEAQGAAATGAIDAGSAAYAQRLGDPAFAAPTSRETAAAGVAGADARLAALNSGDMNELADVTDMRALNAGNAKAMERAQLTASPAGRGVLLGEQYGAANGGYSIGSSMLDSALAGAGAGRRLANSGRQYGGRLLTDYLATAKTNATNQFGRATESASAAKAAGERYLKDNPDNGYVSPGLNEGPAYSRRPGKRLPRPDKRNETQ